MAGFLKNLFVGRDKSNEALQAFVSIFEDNQKCNDENEWRAYFLSDAFLCGYCKKGNLEELVANYLKKQRIYPLEELPLTLIRELTIVYGMEIGTLPEDSDSDVPGSAYIKEIVGMQLEPRLNTIMFDKRVKETNVRKKTFEIYRELLVKTNKKEFTQDNRKEWEHILYGGRPSSIFELGDMGDVVVSETRSVDILKLYEHWIATENVPQMVCAYMYKEYGLAYIENSRDKGLYTPLKNIMLSKFPSIEEDIYNGSSKEQMISRFYSSMSRIMNDYQNDTMKHDISESESILKRTNALFESDEWKHLCYDSQLFDRIYERLGVYAIIPPTLTKYALDFYYKNQKIGSGNKMQKLLTNLVGRPYKLRVIAENDERNELVINNATMDDINDENVDFWHYFLMRGFGYRRAVLPDLVQQGTHYAFSDGMAFLPAYIDDVYSPSRIWQKKFTRFDDENERIDDPVKKTIKLPDGRSICAEFHLHYIKYHVDGNECIGPVFTFKELTKYDGKMKSALEYFFMLALTKIEEKEKSKAEKEISRWLLKTPIHPVTIKVISKFLAAGNPSWREEERDASEISYIEQENMCVKAVKSNESIRLWQQTDHTSKDSLFREIEFGWKPFSAACVKDMSDLNKILKPKAIVKESLSLEGLSSVEKAEKVLQAFEENLVNGRAYVKLHYGNCSESNFDRTLCYFKPDAFFDVKIQSKDHERSLEYDYKHNRSKIKEKNDIYGIFCWGFNYSYRSFMSPFVCHKGESGTFYIAGPLGMWKNVNLPELFAKKVNFEDVTKIEALGGILTMSKVDNRLETCYESIDEVGPLSKIMDTVKFDDLFM